MSKQTKKSKPVYPTAKPLTREDLRDYAGPESDVFTFKGYSFWLDGKIIGVAGLKRQGTSWVAFTDIDDVTKKHKFFLHRIVARKLEGYKQKHRRIFIAQDETEATSERWLTRLGFTDLGNGTWIWQR